jgi:anti-anti-sigma factor
MDAHLIETDNVITIILNGKLTFKDHPAFINMVDEVKAKKPQITIDVDALEMIDSAGIGMIFLAQKLIDKNGGKLTIRNPHGQVKRIFDITNIAKQINISNS